MNWLERIVYALAVTVSGGSLYLLGAFIYVNHRLPHGGELFNWALGLLPTAP